MRHIYNILGLLILSTGMACGQGQDTVRFSLEDCHAMALEANSIHGQMKAESGKVAELNRKAALAAMMPKISANGGYMWNSKEAHLLANQTEFSFGTAGVDKLGDSYFEWADGNNLMDQAAQISSTNTAGEQINSLRQGAGQTIADAYQQLYDALTIDLTHVVVAQVGITQPIYVGGRLRELYKIAQTAERMVGIESDAKHDEMIFLVDEAYWRVVSVEEKRALAHKYYDLLDKLEHDVEALIDEGMATQSDLLKVKAKKGEAEVKKLQADNGLILSKMALAQLCGLPLDTVYNVESEDSQHLPLDMESIDIDEAVSHRSELKLLEESEKLAKSHARIAAAGLQPNIVASAGYMYTNPNLDNGIKKDWKGTGFFSAGVVVNVPIVHADDILRYKAAKHEAKLVELKTEEAREMLTLQTTQAKQKLMEAQQKVELSTLNVRNADEVLRMAQESFMAGMVTATDLMMAQTAWLQAASDKVDAEVEARVTETCLRRYTNKL